MGLFLKNKLFFFITTFLGITMISFFAIRLIPGDPVLLMLGERGGDPAVYQSMRENLGLDKPLGIQYVNFLKNVAKGDFGTSIVTRRPVITEFMSLFPATLELGVFSMIFAILLGIPLGIIAAVKRNSALDYGLMSVSLAGYSMPIFWWGLILILVFSVNLGLTPVSGRIGFEYEIPVVTGFMLIDTWFTPDGASAFWDAFKHLILPGIAMGTIPLAVIARMTRSSMIEVLSEDFIRTARAKGLSEPVVVIRHALRNALIPIVTIIGILFGTIITGAILTESIFSWPGIGKWIVASVSARDYPVIQGGILIIAAIIIIINTLIDFSYRILDPKIRGS